MAFTNSPWQDSNLRRAVWEAVLSAQLGADGLSTDGILARISEGAGPVNRDPFAVHARGERTRRSPDVTRHLEPSSTSTPLVAIGRIALWEHHWVPVAEVIRERARLSMHIFAGRAGHGAVRPRSGECNQSIDPTQERVTRLNGPRRS
jgi:hypothetical protein